MKRPAANYAEQVADEALSRSRQGAAAATLAALSNQASANSALGPAVTITQSVSFTPKVSGKLLINGFMQVSDAAQPDTISFHVDVDGTPQVASNPIDVTATSQTAGQSFPGILVQVSVGVPHTIAIVATSGGGHNLSSSLAHNSISVIELPA
jgi:hypothetical protein